MNPQHTIPVLKDGDNYTLSESRAIAIYLVEQFGGDGKVLISSTYYHNLIIWENDVSTEWSIWSDIGIGLG